MGCFEFVTHLQLLEKALELLVGVLEVVLRVELEGLLLGGGGTAGDEVGGAGAAGTGGAAATAETAAKTKTKLSMQNQEGHL